MLRAQVLHPSGRHGSNSDTIEELRLNRLDWLKIGDDCVPERIIEGAADTLWRLRPRLFCAAPDVDALKALQRCVSDYSYACFRMEAPLFFRDNFNRRREDVFAGKTALALVAMPEEAQFDRSIAHCASMEAN
jgi:hypothetical protein